MKNSKSVFEQISDYFKRAPNTLVATKDVLHFGLRGNVDQCMSKLKKMGIIRRITRGLYVRADCEIEFSDEEIAAAKARAFGKEIAVHPAVVAAEMGLSKEASAGPIYVTTGCTSSFKLYRSKKVIKFKATAERKIKLGDTAWGKVMRAIWYLGRRNCGHDVLEKAFAKLNENPLDKYSRMEKLLPQWLSDRLKLLRYQRQTAAA